MVGAVLLSMSAGLAVTSLVLVLEWHFAGVRVESIAAATLVSAFLCWAGSALCWVPGEDPSAIGLYPDIVFAPIAITFMIGVFSRRNNTGIGNA